MRIKNAPIPNPVTPIKKPLAHLADLTLSTFSIASQIINIKINENTFRAVITLTTSQSSNKYSAAGKPIAKSRIEKTQSKFDFKTPKSFSTLSSEGDSFIDFKNVMTISKMAIYQKMLI